MTSPRTHPSPPPLERLAVATDIVIFTVAHISSNQGAERAERRPHAEPGSVGPRLRILLTLRTEPPFAGQWSLPGGFVGALESAEKAAARELETQTGLDGVFLEQLYTFSAPERDPRTRVISIAYYALVNDERLERHSGTRASRWFDLELDRRKQVVIHGSEGREGDISLAFDHALILRTALERIRGKLTYAPIGFQLLPERFTLTDIQHVYEAILGRPIDKRNFRARLLRSGLLRELDAYRTGAHRPARLYTFVERTF